VIALAVSVPELPGRTVLAQAGAVRAFVANRTSNTVSVIDTSTQSVVGTVVLPAGSGPQGIAVNPAGTRVYTTNSFSSPNVTVSVIDTATNSVITTIPLSGTAIGFPAVNPAGTRLYVPIGGTVTIIDTVL
jgi:YVTN family beta-propeller protein